MELSPLKAEDTLQSRGMCANVQGGRHQMHHSTKAKPLLQIYVAGMRVEAASACVLQVALSPSALAEDGSAAKVQAAGSNKAKLRDGTASFTDVSISADAPGQYQLRVAAASRKYSMEDAVTSLQLASSNTVAAITLTPDTPAAGAIGL